MVADLVSFNKEFSKVGIGQKSAKSLPFYAGRYYDPASGRVKILPTVRNSMVNPLSYADKLQYLEARVLNKWNQYV